MLANEMVVEMEHKHAGNLRLLGTPIRLYDTPSSLRISPPELGEHTLEVVRELGFSEDEITAFEAQGTFR